MGCGQTPPHPRFISEKGDQTFIVYSHALGHMVTAATMTSMQTQRCMNTLTEGYPVAKQRELRELMGQIAKVLEPGPHQ